MIAVRIPERRALVARLSACVLPFAFAAVLSASAVAAPPTAPHLITTDPPSSETATANFTLPSILGEAEPEDGVILKSMPLYTPSSVAKPTVHPEYEIQFFQSSECVGPVVARGTAGALEGVGIPVPVSADSATTFSAVQVNTTDEASGCSNPLTYWEGNIVIPSGPGGGVSGGESGTGGGPESGTGQPSIANGGSASSGPSGGKKKSSGGSVGGNNPAGPKPAVPSLRMIPGARANDLTPSVAGSAPGASSVAVYSGASCSGTPIAKGSSTELTVGFKVTVPKNAASTFSAVSIGAQHSACSNPVTYTEDSTAPRTRITMGPGVKTRKRKAVFRFKDITEDPPGTTFVCKADKGKWKPCASPFHVNHLKLGHHVVMIRGTDTAGNVERKPVKRRFIVVPPAGR
jgi:hypothetical protein